MGAGIWRCAAHRGPRGSARSATLDDPPCIAAHAQELREVAPRADMTGLACVDRPDRDVGYRQAQRDATGDHLDLEFEPGLVAVKEGRHQPTSDQPIARLVV